MKLFTKKTMQENKQEGFEEINAFKKKIGNYTSDLNKGTMKLNYIAGSTNASIKSVSGSIAEGKDADIVLLDDDCNVVQVFARGKIIK